VTGSAHELRLTFDRAADRYDAARPDYPARLFDDLVALARLRPWARLLEVGCGTGKATRPLLARGFRVECVELGPELAAHARRALPGDAFVVHRACFEDWEGDTGAFDLVYAATAWHWIDRRLRYEKAHRLLRRGGRLAVWSAGHAFPPGFDPFFTEIQEVYDEIGESHPGPWPPPPPDELPDLRAEIEGSGLFADVATRRYVWGQTYSADEYIALLQTFSGHISMPDWKQQRLYAAVRERIEGRPGRSVHRHWHAILHVACPVWAG
jgi:SAM-dependent methyltransferase